ncbi:MAG: hypothetical protein RMH84_04530, partial [Sulfolobales archaeon]|nr:hypothetical protein [Sulfolobales archaeon]MDW8010840.1 hypothetical protein [Sulfolobales archaeon]
MPQKLGEISARVLKELEELMKYYKPVECFRDGVKVECYEVALELLSRRFSEANLRICNRRKDLCLSLAKNSNVSVVEVSGTEV